MNDQPDSKQGSGELEVTVVSMMAAAGGRHECTWTGKLPIASQGEQANPDLFAFFNRVSEEDADRLEKIGYGLPSLSVGDVVIHSGSAWVVQPMGFGDLAGELVARLGSFGWAR